MKAVRDDLPNVPEVKKLKVAVRVYKKKIEKNRKKYEKFP